MKTTLARWFDSDVGYSFRTSPVAMLAAAIALICLFCSVFAGWVAPHNPFDLTTLELSDARLPPAWSEMGSMKYPLGTDDQGRDILSALIYGARISLLVGIVPSFISLMIGAIMGIISGYYGGRIDFIIMRLADTMIAFPSLLLAMVVMYTLGANLFNIFIALSLVGWAGVARVVRSQTLALKEKEFIEAARAVGTTRAKIMVRHIFPNIVPTLIVLFSLSIPEAIMWESSLSFLGVGVQPPEASWGLLVAKGKEYLFASPLVAIMPGVAILITVLAFNFIGDGLRDALDPYMKD